MKNEERRGKRQYDEQQTRAGKRSTSPHLTLHDSQRVSASGGSERAREERSTCWCYIFYHDRWATRELLIACDWPSSLGVGGWVRGRAGWHTSWRSALSLSYRHQNNSWGERGSERAALLLLFTLLSSFTLLFRLRSVQRREVCLRDVYSAVLWISCNVSFLSFHSSIRFFFIYLISNKKISVTCLPSASMYRCCFPSFLSPSLSSFSPKYL